MAPDRRQVLAGAAAAAVAGALPAAASDQGWEALSRPGALAVMRHALAPGTGDPPDFTLGDCSTQRNLDERGRAQARAIGEAIRARGIGFDRVLTSEWCRCRETAELLALGPVEPFPPLNSFFGRRERGPEQTRQLQAWISTLEPGMRVMFVTHQVNITALTGRFASSGEILALARRGGGEVEVTGEILIRP
jgi:broad specificity phosphatase PhoE